MLWPFTDGLNGLNPQVQVVPPTLAMVSDAEDEPFDPELFPDPPPPPHAAASASTPTETSAPRALAGLANLMIILPIIELLVRTVHPKTAS
jgi:hypothetical protein